MWYLANLFFEYDDFQIEANSLAMSIEKGEIQPLLNEVAKIAAVPKHQEHLIKYGYGDVLPLPNIRDVEISTHQNLILGKWFFILMAEYLESVPNSVGYDCRILSEGLSHLGWSEEDANLLIHGESIAVLFGEKSASKPSVDQKDPYWFWVRPLYSYNQGGWLSVANCKRFQRKLHETYAENIENRKYLRSEFFTGKDEAWIVSFTRGIRTFDVIFESAIEKGCGIYSAIYWDWEDTTE